MSCTYKTVLNGDKTKGISYQQKIQSKAKPETFIQKKVLNPESEITSDSFKKFEFNNIPETFVEPFGVIKTGLQEKLKKVETDILSFKKQCDDLEAQIVIVRDNMKKSHEDLTKIIEDCRKFIKMTEQFQEPTNDSITESQKIPQLNSLPVQEDVSVQEDVPVKKVIKTPNQEEKQQVPDVPPKYNTYRKERDDRWCNNCGSGNHTTKYCGIECERCLGNNHTTEECIAPQCTKCGEFFHTAENCVNCLNCRKRGHKTEDCYLCTKCKRGNHIAKDCRN